jgi:hypothetical protein
MKRHLLNKEQKTSKAMMIDLDFDMDKVINTYYTFENQKMN